jgi:hypothetical protein
MRMSFGRESGQGAFAEGFESSVVAVEPLVVVPGLFAVVLARVRKVAPVSW